MKKLFIPLLAALLSVSCFAQEKNGNGAAGKVLWQKNGIVINDSQGRSIKQNTRIVNLDDNSFVIVWEDERNGYIDIFAQRMDRNGNKLWGKEGILVCGASRNQTFPQLIRSGKNEVIIVWQDYRNEYSDIYAQKIDAGGNVIWSSDDMPVCTANGNQIAPQLASDSKGGAIITWYDYRSGRGEDIYAQRIDPQGAAMWANNGVPICIEGATQWYPQIISDGSGGAVICWEDKRSGYYDIYSQRIDGGGRAMWQINGIAVCDAPENQQYCQIDLCGQNSFVIAWQDYRNGNADIYAQRIDLNGRATWKTNGEAICNINSNQERPQVIGDENPIITWTDFRTGSGNSNIYAQKISPEGKLLWELYGVALCQAGENQNNVRLCTDMNGGAVAVWQDFRDGKPAIFARRVSRDGKPLWVADGKTVCRSSYSAEYPQIALIDGDVAVVWQDKRNGGLEIFAQLMTLSGSELWKKNGLDVVNAFGSVTQQKPRIVKAGNDSYIVVFEDYRNGYSNIYAQKFDNSGKLIWPREGIQVCVFDSNQLNPVVAEDGNGGAIVAWEDMRGSMMTIFAQRLDPDGNRLWDDPGIIVCPTESEKSYPQITKDGMGGAIIAWQETRKDTNFTNLYAQRLSKGGKTLWPAAGTLLSDTSNTKTNLKVNLDNEGGAIITWVEYAGKINTPDIYAQRIDGSGKILWGLRALSICRAPDAQRNPDIAANGEFIIVWEDSGGGNYDIYAQKINKDGQIAWTCDGVPVCVAPFTQHEPKIAAGGDGGATVVWEDYRRADWDIFAQRISASGNISWNKDSVEVCKAPGTQYSPQIIRSRDITSIIAWEDYRNNKSYGIYAQRLSGDGKSLWEPDGTPVCVTDGGSRGPQMVDDGEGGVVIVWTDFRYGTYDIYTQRINEEKAK